jgi:hypothetical protein
MSTLGAAGGRGADRISGGCDRVLGHPSSTPTHDPPTVAALGKGFAVDIRAAAGKPPPKSVHLESMRGLIYP